MIPVAVPALRERLDDLPLLTEYLAAVHAQPDADPLTLSEGFMALLARHDWPGNVRELSNLFSVSPPFIPALALEPQNVPPSLFPQGLLAADGQGSPPAPAEDDPLGCCSERPRATPSRRRSWRGRVGVLSRGGGPAEQLADFESTLIARALQASGGNVSQAARLLKVQRTTLIEKINKYELGS